MSRDTEEIIRDTVEKLRPMFRAWAAREREPRTACPDCQFEYVNLKEHTCNEG